MTRKEAFMKEFDKVVAVTHNPHAAWRDFITLAACALSNTADTRYRSERENRYTSTIGRYDEETQKLFPSLFSTVSLFLLEEQRDFLGEVYEELGLQNKYAGQFFTPSHIGELMAKISISGAAEQAKKNGIYTVYDPCCGAGALLITAAAEARRTFEQEGMDCRDYLLIEAQDIDETAAMMCYIQLSLLGVAAVITVGNSLLPPSTIEDNCRWYTPAYIHKLPKWSKLISEKKVGESNDKNVQHQV